MLLRLLLQVDSPSPLTIVQTRRLLLVQGDLLGWSGWIRKGLGSQPDFPQGPGTGRRIVLCFLGRGTGMETPEARGDVRGFFDPG